MITHIVGIFDADIARHYQVQVDEPFAAGTAAAHGVEIYQLGEMFLDAIIQNFLLFFRQRVICQFAESP